MLSIIIVNYKNEQKTIDYIKEELSKIDLSYKVIVVNNEATNESNTTLINGLQALLINKIEDKIDVERKYYVVPHNENLGFAKGNNLGVKFSELHFKNPYILFSNNDIRFLNKDVTESLVKKIEELPNVGIIGPKVIGLKGESQSPEPYYSFGLRYFWRYWLTPFLSKKQKNKWLKFGYFENAKEGIHYKVMGSFFIVKTVDFIKCGMMDPNTFLYAEEVILSERMKQISKETYFYPKVGILHEHGATISKNASSFNMKKFQFESESYYYKKYKKVSSFVIKLGYWSMIFHHWLKSKL